MFIEQVYSEFRLLMDKSFSGSYPEIEPLEIDANINNTILQFIHNRYGINNLYRQGFEQSQKRTDDLSSLVRTCYFSPESITTESDYRIVAINLRFAYKDVTTTILSSYKYLHYLKGNIQATLSKTDSCGNITSSTGITTIKIVTQEEVTKLIFDPFNKPSVSSSFGVFENGYLMLYIPSNVNYTVNKVKITYLKYPNIARFVETPTLITSATALAINTYYEVFTGSVTYNGRVYNIGEWFETNNTITAFTGSGQLRLFTGVELPDYVTRELIKYMVDNYLETLESPRLNTLEGAILPKVE